MSLMEQAGLAAGLPPLQLTFARWRNRKGEHRLPDGTVTERWAKVLAHKGSYNQFAYGTDTPSDWGGQVQRCIICSPITGTIAIDVDSPEQYATTRTARFIQRGQAISVRGPDHWHALIDARLAPHQDWPSQGPIAGGDIKSNGFIPVPGCHHYSGERYELPPGDTARPIIAATPELMAAMVADRADCDVHRRGLNGSGGSGGGHDGELAGAVLRMVLQGMARDQVYAEWLKLAAPRDPGWPFTEHDFERHYQSAVRKAAEIRSRDSAVLTSWSRGAAVMQPQPQPQPASPLLLVRSWREAEASFRKWLHDDDQVPSRIVMAAYAANWHLTGDPVWIMEVGGSGGGKTERMTPLTGLPGVVLASTLTGEAALLSASPKRERATGATGGLLRMVGDKGILVVKDFTSVISMSRDRRSEVTAALREIYDGRWDRHYGTDGGQVLTWEGHCGFIAGCTTAIDTAHAVLDAMGTRFLFVRMSEPDTDKMSRAALRQVGSERLMRAELRDVTHALLRQPQGRPHELHQDVQNWLVPLASFACLGRSPVLRDYSGEVQVVGDPEAPTRMIKQLGQLWKACGLIGLDETASWHAVRRAGLDSIPKLRRAVLHHLTVCGTWAKTGDIVEAVRHPYRTTLRTLEDLHAHGLIERAVDPLDGRKHIWVLTEQARMWATKIGTV